ncbi:MAG: Chemotaxis protein MotB [Candidatus Accumulibacter sp. BA-94]|uniref:flagellar motor protein MotB n=1 Tax=Accumulibacter sp. TaxID=2053492 RepID=UPI000450FC21|nr:flagellar motor protein MotB [Accumulibacter sp.]EXI92955.1 MAG: Chemotaxis protein MotB [Candidatus Accumulibacter sp. BA-94]MBL8391535.1 flagellar motor protein MotB [Accumulibacter sp.]HRD87789.1 flagellar motor protein MotB [Accumulibacter sp.]
MSDDLRPIVVKRIKKVSGGHHGGAWKIAYADFVTAMMAFFLLMWLLGSTASGDLKGIADYFQNPLKIASQGGSGTGDSSSVLKGGGKDLTRTAGQVKGGDIDAKSKTVNLKETNAEQARREFEEREKVMLGELKQSIEKLIESNPALRQFKNQLLVDVTSEGLRIQIVDEQNRPMFDTSSAEVKPYTRVILREIGKALNAVPNKLSLSGHTDAAQFGGGDKGFSNWELSANRANASRRELIAGGMDEHKVLRVVGLASTVLFDRNDPLSSINRRISIVVLNRKAEESLLQEDGKVDAVEVGAQGLDPAAVAAPEARGK